MTIHQAVDEFLKMEYLELLEDLMQSFRDGENLRVLEVLFEKEAFERMEMHRINQLDLSIFSVDESGKFQNWFLVLDRKKVNQESLLVSFECKASLIDFLKYDYLALDLLDFGWENKIDDFQDDFGDSFFEKVELYARVWDSLGNPEPLKEYLHAIEVEFHFDEIPMCISSDKDFKIDFIGKREDLLFGE